MKTRIALRSIRVTLAKMIRFLPLFLGSAVGLALCATPRVIAQDVRSGKIIVRFESVGIVLDRRFIPRGPNPRRFSQEEWNRINQYEMKPGQVLEIDREFLPPNLPCRQFLHTRLELRRYRHPETFIAPRHDWQLNPTANSSISEVVPPLQFRLPGHSMRLYRFEENDLRDFQNQNQSFTWGRVSNKEIIRMTIKIHPNVDIRISISSPTCFMRDGVQTTRQLRDFFAERLRASP
jgi:hypothetical protein